MTLHTFDVEQGSPQWHDLRRGMVTASSVGQLITAGTPDAMAVECPTCRGGVGNSCFSTARKEPTQIKTFHDARAALASELPPVYQPANNDTSRNLTALLVAERITGFTDPTWQSNDMFRGVMEEPLARDLYSQHFAPVTEVGFQVRDEWGFSIGFSPDGLVGDVGLIEVKSRRNKKHLVTVLSDSVPSENYMQLQCSLLVSGRKWIDYISYSGGMNLWRKRIYPDPAIHAAIVGAVGVFEKNAERMASDYLTAVAGLPATERLDLEVVI